MPDTEDTCDVCNKPFEAGAAAVAHGNRGWIDDTGRFRNRWRHQACNRAHAEGQTMRH